MLLAETDRRQQQASFPYTTINPKTTKFLSRRSCWKTPLFEG